MIILPPHVETRQERNYFHHHLIITCFVKEEYVIHDPLYYNIIIIIFIFKLRITSKRQKNKRPLTADPWFLLYDLPIIIFSCQKIITMFVEADFNILKTISLPQNHPTFNNSFLPLCSAFPCFRRFILMNE